MFTPVPNPPAPTTPTPTTTTLQASFEHILTFRTSQQGEQGKVSTWNLSFPPPGARDTPSASTPQGEVGTTHLALSLKEMMEIPGGAFRTFWEPEYKMSMPRMGREKEMSEISQRNLPNRCVCPVQTMFCDWGTKSSLIGRNQDAYGRVLASDLRAVSSN